MCCHDGTFWSSVRSVFELPASASSSSLSSSSSSASSYSSSSSAATVDAETDATDQLLHDKFAVAGFSARYMFDCTVADIKRRIHDDLNQVRADHLFENGLLMATGAFFSKNGLLSFVDDKIVFVSEFVARSLRDSNSVADTQVDHYVVQLLASPSTHPILRGWLFQLHVDFLVLRIHSLTLHFVPSGSFETLSSTALFRFDDVSEIAQSTQVAQAIRDNVSFWLFPVQPNFGCLDWIFVRPQIGSSSICLLK